MQLTNSLSIPRRRWQGESCDTAFFVICIAEEFLRLSSVFFNIAEELLKLFPGFFYFAEGFMRLFPGFYIGRRISYFLDFGKYIYAHECC
jgi:hypothetical protein